LGARRRRKLATAQARLGDLPVRELPSGLRVFEAATWARRRDGLAGLDALPESWGLELRPCRAVHMQGMRFALDLVWLDGRGRVVKVTEGLRPGRFAACRRARSVVEVGAGQGARFAAALEADAVDVGAAPAA
jgi:uncharacterized membrane protein (UPF0127 family)